jgi:hypothetical protein
VNDNNRNELDKADNDSVNDGIENEIIAGSAELSGENTKSDDNIDTSKPYGSEISETSEIEAEEVDGDKDVFESNDADENDDDDEDEDEDEEDDDEDDNAPKGAGMFKKNRNSSGKKDRDSKTGIEKTKVKKVKRLVDKRFKSMKLVSVSSAILFIAIVIIFNLVFDSFIGGKLKWDWTQTNLYSVGDVTKELLGGLKKDIKIVGLYEKGTDTDLVDIEKMLDDYTKYSKGKLKVQFIDPVKTPSIITQLDPDGLLKPAAGSFVVRCDANKKSKVLIKDNLFSTQMNEQTYQREVTGVTAEQAFSGAIVYTSSKKTPVVYMSKGQGELDYTTNYTIMTSILRDNNFLVKDFDMLTSAKIPDDAELLIMLSPSSDISQTGVGQINTFLKKGKSLLVITAFGTTKFPVLNSLLADYNIEITNDRVREGDKTRRYSDDPYSFFADAPVSFLTEQAVEKATFLKNVRAINEIKNTKEYIKVNPVFQTSAEGVIEKGGVPENSGTAGITDLGLASENSGSIDGTNVTTSTKVIVIGSTDFISDTTLNNFGQQVYNVYAFYYSLNWLVNLEGSDLLITAKELPSYKLTKGDANSFWIVTIVCIILIPLALLLAATFVYRRRKNL